MTFAELIESRLEELRKELAKILNEPEAATKESADCRQKREAKIRCAIRVNMEVGGYTIQ